MSDYEKGELDSQAGQPLDETGSDEYICGYGGRFECEGLDNE